MNAAICSSSSAVRTLYAPSRVDAAMLSRYVVSPRAFVRADFWTLSSFEHCFVEPIPGGLLHGVGPYSPMLTWVFWRYPARYTSTLPPGRVHSLRMMSRGPWDR